MVEKDKNDVSSEDDDNLDKEAETQAGENESSDVDVEIEDGGSEVEQETTPEEQIEALEIQAQELKEKLLRTAAELDNVRKRARRDVEDSKVYGRTEVLRDILPVIDSLDLALSSADPSGSAEAIIEGVAMVRKQFLNATERYNLKPIETADQVFDPNFHEAVAQVASQEIEMGRIVEEIRKGYLLGDRLLRAAMVVVSKGAETKAPADPVSESDPAPEPEESFVEEPTTNTEGENE